MSEIVTKSLELLVMVCVAVCFGYLIPLIKRRAGQDKVEIFRKWVGDAVMYAQQVFMENGEKKDVVTEILRDIRDKQGIPLSDAQIDIMIEAAVRQMKLIEGGA